MRYFNWAFLAYCALSGIGPTAIAADADAEVLRRFGMLGRLAVDCAAPYSQSNPHQVYAVSPGGAVTRTLRIDTTARPATLPLRNVRMLATDLLRFEEAGRAAELTISIVKVEGKFRNWESTQANGTVLIADGRFSDSGRPTITFTFCGN